MQKDKTTIAQGRSAQYGDIRLKCDDRTHKADVKLSSFLSAGRPTKEYHASITFAGVRGGARSKSQPKAAPQEVSPDDSMMGRKSTRQRCKTAEADFGLDLGRAGGKRKAPPKAIDLVTARKKAKKERNFVNEVRKLQKLTKTVGPKAPWKRVVREIAEEVHKFNKCDGPLLKWNTVAMVAIQEAGEHFISGLMKDADMIAACADRKTVMPKDFRTAQAIGRHPGLVCRQEKPLIDLKKEAEEAAAQAHGFPEDDGDGFSSREDSQDEEREGESQEDKSEEEEKVAEAKQEEEKEDDEASDDGFEG